MDRSTAAEATGPGAPDRDTPEDTGGRQVPYPGRRTGPPADTGAQAMHALMQDLVALLVTATEVLTPITDTAHNLTHMMRTTATHARKVDRADIAEALDALGAWITTADHYAAANRQLGSALAALPEHPDPYPVLGAFLDAASPRPTAAGAGPMTTGRRPDKQTPTTAYSGVPAPGGRVHGTSPWEDYFTHRGLTSIGQDGHPITDPDSDVERQGWLHLPSEADPTPTEPSRHAPPSRTQGAPSWLMRTSDRWRGPAVIDADPRRPSTPAGPVRPVGAPATSGVRVPDGASGPVPVVGYLRLGAGGWAEDDLSAEQARARRELYDHAHRRGMTITAIHQDLPGTGYRRPGLAALIRHVIQDHLTTGQPVNVLLPDTTHLSNHPDIGVALGALLTDLGSQIITVRDSTREDQVPT